MNEFLKDMETAYKIIRENAPAPQPVQNNLKAPSSNQQTTNYTNQYLKSNPTKQLQPTNTSVNSQDQINTLIERLGNLEKMVADLVAKQQQPIM